MVVTAVSGGVTQYQKPLHTDTAIGEDRGILVEWLNRTMNSGF